MERDLTQSLLDKKFPNGANVVIRNGKGAPFNVARFIVLDDTTIRCNPHGYPVEVSFEPKQIVEEEDGSVTFKEALNGLDVWARPAPAAVWAELEAERPSDLLIQQLRGDES